MLEEGKLHDTSLKCLDFIPVFGQNIVSKGCAFLSFEIRFRNKQDHGKNRENIELLRWFIFGKSNEFKITSELPWKSNPYRFVNISLSSIGGPVILKYFSVYMKI